ncbi:unnamed protein product [Larinioides sclopetarius]|uniref:Ribosomal protein L16 n=1 Tax=Larinioides sclopetarius TaxID=280406 RepID=A0AAV1ZH02_9ARAC
MLSFRLRAVIMMTGKMCYIMESRRLASIFRSLGFIPKSFLSRSLKTNIKIWMKMKI